MKVKLLKLFRWTQRSLESEPNGLPIRGIWQTEAVYSIGNEDQHHEMVCVMPDGKMCKYGQKLKVYTKIIEACMTEMELVEVKSYLPKE